MIKKHDREFASQAELRRFESQKGDEKRTPGPCEEELDLRASQRSDLPEDTRERIIRRFEKVTRRYASQDLISALKAALPAIRHAIDDLADADDGELEKQRKAFEAAEVNARATLRKVGE